MSEGSHSPLPPKGGQVVPVEAEIVEAEVVDGRSTRRTHWFVRQGHVWVKAAEWPGVRQERRDAGPGTVWERALWLTLPPGTTLMRVDVRPRPTPPRDPLEHLRSGPTRALKVTRRLYYSVGRGGRLVPTQEP